METVEKRKIRLSSLFASGLKQKERKKERR
jgi:hypothetical protein